MIHASQLRTSFSSTSGGHYWPQWFRIYSHEHKVGVQERLDLATVVAMKGIVPLSAQLPSALPCASVPELEGGKISLIRLNDGEVHGPYGTY